MKVHSIKLEDIVINEDISTRKSGHDKDSIDRIARSYVQRHTDGMDPVQIKPGLVRALDGKEGKYEMIDGLGRFLACQSVNEIGGLDGEPMEFQAVVARANDEASIISGIQANFHEAIDIFDQADAMAKLEALGKKQKDIAKVFGVSEPTVSQFLKLNKCPKKYVQAYRDGDLEKDAVIAIADLDTSDTQRTEIFEEAVRHTQRVQDILAKKEFRDKKAALDAELAAAKEKAEALEKAAKEAEKAAKKADAELSKAKNEAETKAAREAKAEADKAKKKLGKEWADAERAKVRLKEQKEKLIPPTTGKKKSVSAEEVRNQAKEKGVSGVKGAPRTKAQFIAELEAMDNLPESCKRLIGRIEGFLDGEDTVAQLRKAFLFNCVPDEEAAPSVKKAAKGGK